LYIKQGKEKKHTVGLGSLIPAKQRKTAKKTLQLSQNNLSTSPHRLAVVAIRWQLVVFVCVKIVHL